MSLAIHLHECRMKIKHLKGTISLEEMSSRVGCSKSYLSDIENGNNINPSLRICVCIAKHYKTTVNKMIKAMT